MPEQQRPPELSHPVEITALREDRDARVKALWDNRLRSSEDIEAQRAWQTTGSESERGARNFFDVAAGGGAAGEPVPVGLPDTDALVAELARAAQDPAYQPTEQWRDVIEVLRHHTAAGKEINVLELLAQADVSASVRWDWWQKEIAGLFRYAEEHDWARLRDEQEVIPPPAPEAEQDELFEPPLELPPPKQDRMKTSMDELAELKEGESRGYFSVHPFWGGYYREEVYERHAGGSSWEKSARTFSSAPEIGHLHDEHVMRGTVAGGAVTDLPLPYGFYPNPRELRATGEAKLIVDEHGLYSIDVRGSTEPVSFTLVIGRSARSPFTAREPSGLAVRDIFVSDEARAMLAGLVGDAVEKARRIKSWVQARLKYSNDSTLNSVYEQNPAGYFAAIDQHKQADCDVANAYYINLLSAAGIKARMVAGHYVKNSDRKGAAVMGSGTRHAWSEAWDETAKTWVRFDATPEKDPTLDDERPDEKPEDEAGPRPGDYGEQEAQKLSEEELEAWRKKLIKAAEEAKTKTPEQLRDEQFARDGGCTREEAAAIRGKLEAARRLRDSKGRVIRDQLSIEFQEIVESNYKERAAWKGPVAMSEGDELDDIVMAGIDAKAGSANPLGYTEEVTERHLTQEYGGMDVYVAADRSGSMDEIDPTTQKPKKDEQQLALFLLLDSLYGFSYKTEVAAKQDQLISPLSVRSGVVAFQAGSADTIKPLGATWKPAEQVSVWKGLESNVGGGTPAHLGLARVRAQIELDIVAEKKLQPVRGGKKRLRVVVVFMDGGVDQGFEDQYLAEQKALEDLGVYVSSWGMTESARAVEAYPQGHCVPSAREMIEPVTKHLIERAQALKLKQQ